MSVRLNKHIAETGYCSRREADRLIAARRVTVNGRPGGVGAVVGEGDEVQVDGQPLRARANWQEESHDEQPPAHRFQMIHDSILCDCQSPCNSCPLVSASSRTSQLKSTSAISSSDSPSHA